MAYEGSENDKKNLHEFIYQLQPKSNVLSGS